MSGKAIRETLGVRGLWGLEQLERMGLSLAKLTLLVMIGSVTVSLLAMVLFTGISDEQVLPSLFQGFLNGLVVFAALALARWTQADIESLLPIAPEIEPSMALLPPTRKLVFGCLVGSLIWHGALFNFALAIGLNLSFAEVLQIWATAEGFFGAVVFPSMIALAVAPFLVVVIRQVKALTYAARHIDMDILELDHYPRLANPLIRIVVFSLVIGSFMPIGFLIDQPGTRVLLLVVLQALVLSVVLLVVAYAYPVWLLRGRIRAAKDKELDCVFRSLRGDDEAMSRSRIADRAHSLSFSELLDYRGFIESLWEWPVAPHIQRVLLFGLLPLTTWVLAALIENAISVVVAAG